MSLDNSAVNSYIGMARLRGGCFFSVIYGVTISTLSFHSVNEEGNGRCGRTFQFNKNSICTNDECMPHLS